MKTKRIIVMGATSGIGREVALAFLKQGHYLGLAARRERELAELKALSPERIEIMPVDITADDAPQRLLLLVQRLGGMDIYFHSSGTGSQNPLLDPAPELATTRLNVDGFTRMVTAVFSYFAEQRGGHIAIISSIAGTRGIGVAPAYSASKRFQTTYINALAQLSNIRKLGITFTDIRPGFVQTPLLTCSYPYELKASKVASSIVKAIARRRRRIVIDWKYALLVFAWSLTPQRLWERMTFAVSKEWREKI